MTWHKNYEWTRPKGMFGRAEAPPNFICWVDNCSNNNPEENLLRCRRLSHNSRPVVGPRNRLSGSSNHRWGWRGRFDVSLLWTYVWSPGEYYTREPFEIRGIPCFWSSETIFGLLKPGCVCPTSLSTNRRGGNFFSLLLWLIEEQITARFFDQNVWLLNNKMHGTYSFRNCTIQLAFFYHQFENIVNSTSNGSAPHLQATGKRTYNGEAL